MLIDPLAVRKRPQKQISSAGAGAHDGGVCAEIDRAHAMRVHGASGDAFDLAQTEALADRYRITGARRVDGGERNMEGRVSVLS